MLLLLLFSTVVLPLSLYATTGDVVSYQETADWIIFKKNGDEVFAAKQCRYCDNPVFYAHDNKGEIYFNDQAQELWEELEEMYREKQEQEQEAPAP